MTPDARVMTYTSEATNVVAASTFGQRQIFARSPTDTLGTSYCSTHPNATGLPAEISARGSGLVAANQVTLDAVSLPPNVFGYFITSRDQGFVANPAGSQGNLCLSGSIGRLVGPGQIQNAGPTGTISLSIDVQMIPQPLGILPWNSGGTWNFQAWFRDSVTGVPTSNFSDGIEITLL